MSVRSKQRRRSSPPSGRPLPRRDQRVRTLENYYVRKQISGNENVLLGEELLTPERSIAVDRNIIPLGAPAWLDTELREGGDTHYRHRVIPITDKDQARDSLAQDAANKARGRASTILTGGTGLLDDDTAKHYLL
ncbi:MAG: hypothetical protein GY906_03705 [bacterium]|nr:hypothetical protein [bacterium]